MRVFKVFFHLIRKGIETPDKQLVFEHTTYLATIRELRQCSGIV